jgi:hypothetical protein
MKHDLYRRASARNPVRAAASKLSRTPETAAGAFVHQRYHVPAAISDLIAALAGLGGNRDSLQ